MTWRLHSSLWWQILLPQTSDLWVVGSAWRISFPKGASLRDVVSLLNPLLRWAGNFQIGGKIKTIGCIAGSTTAMIDMLSVPSVFNKLWNFCVLNSVKKVHCRLVNLYLKKTNFLSIGDFRVNISNSQRLMCASRCVPVKGSGTSQS